MDLPTGLTERQRDNILKLLKYMTKQLENYEDVEIATAHFNQETERTLSDEQLVWQGVKRKEVRYTGYVEIGIEMKFYDPEAHRKSIIPLVFGDEEV